MTSHPKSLKEDNALYNFAKIKTMVNLHFLENEDLKNLDDFLIFS